MANPLKSFWALGNQQIDYKTVMSIDQIKQLELRRYLSLSRLLQRTQSNSYYY